MLTALHIENIAIIERLDIDFKDGFTVLTGETGAGNNHGDRLVCAGRHSWRLWKEQSHGKRAGAGGGAEWSERQRGPALRSYRTR